MPVEDAEKNAEYVREWRKKNADRIRAARHVANELLRKDRKLVRLVLELRKLLDADEMRTLAKLLAHPPAGRIPPRTCPICGKSMQGLPTKAKYDSDECAKEAQRRQNATRYAEQKSQKR